MQINTSSKTVWIVALILATLALSYGAMSLLDSPISNTESATQMSPSKTSSKLNTHVSANLSKQTIQADEMALEREPFNTNIMLGDDRQSLAEAPLPRLLSGYTQAGAKLDTYLEAQDVAYLDSSFYPFDPQTESILKRYATSGKMLLFDNTQAKENLLEFNKTSGDVVSDYYGTGSESAMTLATSIKLANGGIEYMVLPISISEQEESRDLTEKVKLAIELFQQEQAIKQEANTNS